MERAAIIGGRTMPVVYWVLGLWARSPAEQSPRSLHYCGDTLKVAEAYDEITPEHHNRIILVDTFKDEAEETLRVAKASSKGLEV